MYSLTFKNQTVLEHVENIVIITLDNLNKYIISLINYISVYCLFQETHLYSCHAVICFHSFSTKKR